MKKENTLEIRTDDLIALIHIFDKYQTFSKRLTSLISIKYNRDIIYQLGQISRGEVVTDAKKIKKFYEKNKKVIDTINKYSNINMFIYLNYDAQGNAYKERNLGIFYQYILKNKNKKDQVLSLLERLKELGFENIEFNPNIDFTRDIYNIDSKFNQNSSISYLDNIEIILNNKENIVSYKTIDSNYKIILKTSLDEFSKHGKEIVLNSLLFSPKQLPENITKENIFDKIIKLYNEEKDKDTAIKNMFYLKSSIKDLDEQFKLTNEIINNLDKVYNKKELIEFLNIIKTNIEMLNKESSNYNEYIFKNIPSIAKETFDTEKELYLRRKYLSIK